MTVVKRVLARTVLAISFIALLVPLFIATYVNFTQDAWPTWSGFGVNRGPILQSNEQFQREKTYWDLLQLLVIPLGLAVGGYLLNQSARRSELQIAEQNSQESALKSYLDYIKELLLDKSLREDSEAQALATAQTRTVLRTLNGERRGHVLQFLHDARLIQKNNPLINLEDANLQSAKLQRADLHGACLRGVDLQGSDLRGANLRDADMSHASLVKATLSPHWRKITSHYGTRIIYLGFSRADLSHADLTGADLRGADLRGACLHEAKLSEAFLTKADFRIFTIRARLSNISTSVRSDLDEKQLQAALLHGAILSREQRRTAKM